MSIRFTINRFPRDAQARDVTGLPWACVVQPFAAFEDPSAPTGHAAGSSATSGPASKWAPPRKELTSAEDVARCEECFGYINPYCTIDRALWRCSLCGVVNSFSNKQLPRYTGKQATPPEELAKPMVELDVASDIVPGTEQMGHEGHTHTHNERPSDVGLPNGDTHLGDREPVSEADLRKRPAYVALVDVTGSEELLELIKSSLLAALEALPSSALFGLATFSDSIGLYDLQGEMPVVRQVPIPENPKEPLAVELEDVLPLGAFLAPVSVHKDDIAAALETIRQSSAPSVHRRSTHDPNSPFPPQPLRGFGTAVNALVSYLGSQRRDTTGLQRSVDEEEELRAKQFLGAKALVFLAGRPNFGQGQLTSEEYLLSLQGADSVDGDKDLLKERSPFYREVAAAAVQAGVSVDLFAIAGGPPPEATAAEGEGVPSEAGQGPGKEKQMDARIKALIAEDTGYFDLASLGALSRETGGSMFRYPSPEDATLPQDIYRMLSRPQALSGVLRLRTSREFGAVRAYGRLFQDKQYEDLYHVFRSDPFDTFAFDFEYSSKAGFADPSDQVSAPTVQLAFQYTVILPPLEPPQPDEGEEREREGEGDGGPPKLANGVAPSPRHRQQQLIPPPVQYDMFGRALPVDPSWKQRAALAYPGAVVRRVLRVHTVQVDTGETPQELYESSDNEAILAVLTHKIIRASTEEGVMEGRLLIRDWLIILTAHYNDAYKLAQFGQPASVTRLDVAFAACPQLQPIPRLVFALLRSPLLQFHREGVHPDLRTYLQCLFETLDPAFLMRAVYPMLSSYLSPDRQAFPRHSLSRAALITSGSPIFLLDAFTTIVVFYAPNASPELPYPPPQGSLLRTTVNRLKSERIITPRTFFIRGSTDGTELFERFLIEEQDVDGLVEGGATGMGFVSFLEGTALEVREYMK